MPKLRYQKLILQIFYFRQLKSKTAVAAILNSVVRLY